MSLFTNCTPDKCDSWWMWLLTNITSEKCDLWQTSILTYLTPAKLLFTCYSWHVNLEMLCLPYQLWAEGVEMTFLWFSKLCCYYFWLIKYLLPVACNFYLSSFKRIAMFWNLLNNLISEVNCSAVGPSPLKNRSNLGKVPNDLTLWTHNLFEVIY